MKFVYPAGLWALAGVLVVAGVYLFRRKYEEKPVSSVYLWKLAQNFSKRNSPIQRLKRALVAALQLLSVAAACLMIAQPLIPVPGAQVHYAAIVDASASMQIADGQGVSRFQRALAALEQDVARLPWGSSVSVVVAGDQAQILADHLPKSQVGAALDQARCGLGQGSLEEALALCRDLVRGEDQACLYTDRDYAQTVNIQARNMSGQQEWNLSVLSLEAADASQGFTAQVVSGGKDAVVSFDLFVDGVLQPASMMDIYAGGEKLADLTVHCPKDQVVTLSLTARQVSGYAQVRLVANVEDGLAADNQYQLFSAPEGTVSTLLVSQTPFFLSSALSAFPQVDLQTAASPQDIQAEGYDLYIFEGCLPESLPQDGALWLINPPATVEEIGLVLGEALRGCPWSRGGRRRGTSGRLAAGFVPGPGRGGPLSGSGAAGRPDAGIGLRTTARAVGGERAQRMRPHSGPRPSGQQPAAAGGFRHPGAQPVAGRRSPHAGCPGHDLRSSPVSPNPAPVPEAVRPAAGF